MPFSAVANNILQICAVTPPDGSTAGLRGVLVAAVRGGGGNLLRGGIIIAVSRAGSR